ncbi:MAG: DUF1345 domain-containing protein [Bacteroidota bacterium]|nr:DUF1345 domain-containing protein [Bacteroidota bacterium]
MPRKKSESKEPLFERLHSAHKLLICIVIAVIVYFIVNIKHIDSLTHIMIGWDTFSICMIVMSWITFSITTSEQIRNQAKVQDSSRMLIFVTVLVSTFASFLAVLLLIISKKFKDTEALHLTVAIAGMLFAWFLVHTIFTFRYAHIFYGDDEEKSNTHAGGLEFPNDKKPDYIDFAYFSFVLGMTFQVSDVDVTSKRLRRLSLLHSILSFIFNTVMIALTINIMAGLSG